MASSYRRVVRSQRAVEYPATKIPSVTMEKACIYSVMPSVEVQSRRKLEEGALSVVLESGGTSRFELDEDAEW